MGMGVALSSGPNQPKLNPPAKFPSKNWPFFLCFLAPCANAQNNPPGGFLKRSLPSTAASPTNLQHLFFTSAGDSDDTTQGWKHFCVPNIFSCFQREIPGAAAFAAEFHDLRAMLDKDRDSFEHQRQQFEKAIAERSQFVFVFVCFWCFLPQGDSAEGGSREIACS